MNCASNSLKNSRFAGHAVAALRKASFNFCVKVESTEKNKSARLASSWHRLDIAKHSSLEHAWMYANVKRRKRIFMCQNFNPGVYSRTSSQFENMIRANSYYEVTI